MQCLVLLSTGLALSGVTVGVVQTGIFSLILKIVLFIYAAHHFVTFVLKFE